MARADPTDFIDPISGAWRCIRCGDCCRQTDLIPELGKFDRGDGVCKHLGPDELCQIYETRPERCRVDLSRGAHTNAMSCMMIRRVVSGELRMVRKAV